MSLISVDFYEFKDDPVADLVWLTTKPLFEKTPYKISHCNLVLEFGGNTLVTFVYRLLCLVTVILR